MKIYCCGITSNEITKITDLVTQVKPYVDGFVWCVDSATTDGTIEYLEQNKGAGKIITHPWVNSHDGQMNEFLQSGVIKNGDWIILLDSSECLTEFFLKKLSAAITEWDKGGVTAVFCSGRPYVLKYYDHLFFRGSPHWGIEGFFGEYCTIPEDQKSKYIINKRDLNPVKHYCWHNSKYYLYGRSNQMTLAYGKYGAEIVQRHDLQRLKFRWLLESLGYPLNLDGLEACFNHGKYKPQFIDIVENEFCLSEFFQTKVLGMDFMTEVHPRYRWSFKHFLKTGERDQKYLNYEGVIIKYDKGIFNV